MSDKYRIVILNKKLHQRVAFDCGEPALNDYLQKFAVQHAAQDISQTLVLVSDKAPETILGFYTLSTGQLEREDLPVVLNKHLPRYPVPIARLARLAVVRHGQGQHWGQTLLLDAFAKCVTLSQQIGIFGIVVDAKHERAKQFYQRYGFVELQSQPLTLLIRMSTVRQLFPQSD
ncbi:MAG: hypothetical protein BWK78_08610 [Thiotrichaceae bacterium IS1]|nr:MAG: hypothetical protein BWK78_08610 [Thiotrichaceae bacterium IS1]